MKPQPLVKFFSACLLTSGIFFSSCTKQTSEIYQYPANPNPSTAPTMINVELTAASSSYDFKKVNIDVQGLEYNISNEAGVTEGWEKANLEKTGVINLLSLVNGNHVRLNIDMLPGNVKQLRIKLGENNSIELADTTRSLKVAQHLKESGMVIFTDMETSSVSSNSLWLNFDVSHSIEHDVNADTYELLPIISSFDAMTTGSIEGMVTPADAKPSIMLQTDKYSRNLLINTTTVADTVNEGYFKIIGLPEGSYQVDMIAGDGSNRQKTLVMVEVLAGGTTKLGSQVLE